MPDWLCTACILVQWNGHVVKMDNLRIHKRVIGRCFGGIRSVGRPRRRWEITVCEMWGIAVNKGMEGGN